jgi:hypothetical protein|tara:strand:- start:332 stop:754 length:423 start_codon:yes stop_codon:yes gene_type:complete
MPDINQTGSCLCGNIQYNFNQSKALSAHHCHCIDCQKSTGSGKATIVIIPEDELSITGNLKFYSVTGSQGSQINRGFCQNCGSPVISFMKENPGMKFIKAGTLNDSSWLTIASNFWSSTANNWSPIQDEVETFTHNPDLG